MNSLFEKQVYVRLSDDGTSFIYTVKYGRFATVTREMRLAEKAATPSWAELVRGEITRLAPVGARVSPRRQGNG
jgi:hypothetical protein